MPKAETRVEAWLKKVAAEAEVGKREIATYKYSIKVCSYLGVDTEKCMKMFQKCLRNMKLALEGWE